MPQSRFIAITLAVAMSGFAACVRDRFSGDGPGTSAKPSRPDNDGTEPFEQEPEQATFSLQTTVHPETDGRVGFVVTTAAGPSVFVGAERSGGQSRWLIENGNETSPIVWPEGESGSFTLVRTAERVALVAPSAVLSTELAEGPVRISVSRRSGSLEASLLDGRSDCRGTYRIVAKGYGGAMTLGAQSEGDEFTGRIVWDDKSIPASAIQGSCIFGHGGEVTFERPDAGQSFRGTLAVSGEIVTMAGDFRYGTETFSWSATEE